MLPEIIDIAWKNEQPSTYDADIEENGRLSWKQSLT